ncbi:hypothetical protein O3P69_010419 [Scylla paramamosain]|uniref:Peptidase A2 domain-containing protein n=1 Tax=Scylla paramamosain TaxID=85552 RepID=A0AAW0TWX8_SCYPA
MPLPRRLGATPRGRRSPAAGRVFPSLVFQAQSAFLAQQQAIASLQASLASLSATGQRPSGKAPAGATPEKFMLEMSSAGFRTWRRSVEAWLSLSRWPDQEAVLHIRLLCVADLQCALDVNPWLPPPATLPETPTSRAAGVGIGMLRVEPPAPRSMPLVLRAGAWAPRRVPGHFKRRCRSSGKREAGKAVNSVTVGAAGIAPEPLLQVQLVPQVGGQACTTTAVADTGAQVCVAGPALMSSLGLRPALLQRRAGLRDLAKIPLASLGAAPCHISLPGRSTLQEVHFVKSLERLYLSCTACKELRLVHSGFPHPQSYVAAAETTEGLSDCPPTRPSSLPLPPLEENIPRLEECRSNIAPGSRVLVQNQANKTWDRAGIVVEARGNRQYLVKLDGSGRLSLRTRLHLKPLAQPNPAPPPKPQEPPPEPSPNRPRRRVARPGWLDDYVE